jgi:phenylacetate-CoA ligase
MREFLERDLSELLARAQTQDLSAHVLGLFRETLREVPAYGRFLQARGVEPRQVTDLEAFAGLPSTSKAEYHQAFALPELCRQGRLEGADIVAVSTGSTGEPTFWPRFAGDELGSTLRFEQVLVDGFGLGERRILGVVCFALGSWVGGMYTTFACRNLAAKGYALTLVTPGSNRAEILRVVRALAPLFDDLVLFGYPPYLKDVIDAGRADGLDWTRFRVHLVTAGEVFSEEWRTLVMERLGASEPARQSASLYGTADGGVLANETPLSIGIRRFLAREPRAARELFGESRLPTLCQYDPFHRYFETANGELVFSGDGTVPLIRYRILDRGGMVPYGRMLAFLRDHGYVPPPESLRAYELPFVYVFGRQGFALSFYGANVYPENIAVGLEQPAIAPAVTGKFVMELRHFGAEHDSEISITVELAPGVEAGTELSTAIAFSVREQLERLNSEFANYVPPERRTPRIQLLPLGEPEYFPIGVKHRYTRH